MPISLLSGPSLLLAVVVVYGFVVLRYFLLVGSFYFYFWTLGRGQSLYSRKNRKGQIRKEIYWSLATTIIFAISGVLIGVLWELGLAKFYLNFDEYPLWWLPLSFFAYSLVHEIYFYFTHRWMHLPKVYRKVHAVHHLSMEPSPWASFCFHPLEALIESAILPLMVVLIPIHPLVFLLYLTWMTVSAINNHLGVELMPRFFKRIRWRNLSLFDVFVSATHHAYHHKYYRCNYGLYFTFLDRWLNTERATSDSRPT